jgi:hypothetical protein
MKSIDMAGGSSEKQRFSKKQRHRFASMEAEPCMPTDATSELFVHALFQVIFQI